MIHIKLDKKAKDVISKTADLGSGSIVVTELPQVGEEHTIYELHTTIPPKFNYVPCMNEMEFRYVFENEEAFRDFIRNDASHYNNHNEFYCYCLAEDELIRVYYNSGSANWTLFDKEKENVFIYNNRRLCICKAVIDEHTALLLNGKQVPVGDSDGILYSPVLIHQVKSKILCAKYKFGIVFHIMNSTPPSCVDGVPSVLFMSQDFSAFCTDLNSGIVQWLTKDGSIKVALPSVDGKYRYDKSEKHYYDTNTSNLYNGEFEWVNIEDFNFKEYVDYETYDTIPLSEGAMDKPFIFDPSEKLIISYWIYKNGEWVNVDDIGKPNTITIPVSSSINFNYDSASDPIKLSKVHFYLDNRELDIISIQSKYPDKEDAGYLVVPLPDKSDVSYSLHIVFDNDVLFGSGAGIMNQPYFSNLNGSELNLTNGTTEYDFDIHIGFLLIYNGD